jgi:hypothetical protein
VSVHGEPAGFIGQADFSPEFATSCANPQISRNVVRYRHETGRNEAREKAANRQKNTLSALSALAAPD